MVIPVKARDLVIIATAVAFLGACKSKSKGEASADKTSDKPPPSSTDVKNPPPPKPVKPVALKPESIKWKPFTFDKIGVTFDIIDGVRLWNSAMGASHYARQNQPPIQLAVWWGEGRTMEAWRRGIGNRKGFELGKVNKRKVCGVEAEIQELKIPARKMPTGFTQVPLGAQATTGKADHPNKAQAVTPQPKPTFKTLPARQGIAMGFRLKGSNMPVIASWSIKAEERDAFKKLEEHFFASIKCAKQ